MNIDELTIAQARKAVEDGKAIKAALGLGSKATPPATKSNGIGLSLIGSYVLVRCRDAGVHAGILESYDGRACVLTDSRRLWRFRVPMGKSSFLSGVANYGLADDSKLGDPVDRIMLTENCEVIACRAEAEKSIREFQTCTRTN